MEEEWKVRVREEAEELAEKISKLQKFFDENKTNTDVLGPEDNRLLSAQLIHMRSYHAVLLRRIKRF